MFVVEVTAFPNRAMTPKVFGTPADQLPASFHEALAFVVQLVVSRSNQLESFGRFAGSDASRE